MKIPLDFKTETSSEVQNVRSLLHQVSMQSQRCDDASDFSVSRKKWKLIKSLHNAVATHSGVILLFSIRAVSIASSHCVDADTWCKRALRSV